MKVLQITGPGKFQLNEMPMPKPGPGQALLKVLAVTTCPHWDIHIMGGQPMFVGGELNYPYMQGQPGHAACAEVVEVGPGVTQYKPGQRVCVWRDGGHHQPGCYAQFVVKGIEDLIPIPDTGTDESWAPLELAMCVSAHVMLAEQLDALRGQKVGVFGLGPAGLVCLQLARAAGASEVIGVDPNPARRELALKMGLDAAYTPDGADFAKLPKRLTPGCLYTSFDCVGSPAAVHRAMELTTRLLVLFAVQRQPYTVPPENWGYFILATAQAHTREAAEYACERIADGRLDMAPLVTHVMSLTDYEKGVDLLKSQEAIKIAFRPHAD